MRTDVYLSPGMFGFARLASFEYFGHLATALDDHLRARGQLPRIHICEVHPTASIRRRAAKLADMVAATCDDEGSIHIVGHSTGGLDARLVASPSVHLPGIDAERLAAWLPRLRSVTTMNTPHFGTPLAAFFATVSGQRMLYAITALTVTALKLGAPPLAAASALVAAFGRIQFGGLELEVVERTTDALIRVLDEASSRELRAWLRLLRDDQGSIVQLMPEAMDLFHAAVEDRPGVRYQSVATYAALNGLSDWVSALRSPWSGVSAALFTALYNITARYDERYPCASADGSAQAQLRALLGEVPPPTANDGVVPLYSQVWGELVWAGRADHLDVVGHFPGVGGHTDWLASGARFNRVRFETVIEAIVDGMLAAEQQEPRSRSSAPEALA